VTADPNFPPPPSPEVDALTALLMRHRKRLLVDGPSGPYLDASHLAVVLLDAGWQPAVDAASDVAPAPVYVEDVACPLHGDLHATPPGGPAGLAAQPTESHGDGAGVAGATNQGPLSAPRTTETGFRACSASSPSEFDGSVAG
jgi:hypothetical protein